MNFAAPHPASRFTIEQAQTWPAPGALHVVAIYEGEALLPVVRDVFARLASQAEPFLCVAQKAWSFAYLSRLDTRACAFRDAADADILAVVTDGGKTLPRAVETWLDRCLADQDSGIAALVWVKSRRVELELPGNPCAEELGSRAARRHLDFIMEDDIKDRLNGRHLLEIVRRPASSYDLAEPRRRQQGQRYFSEFPTIAAAAGSAY